MPFVQKHYSFVATSRVCARSRAAPLVHNDNLLKIYFFLSGTVVEFKSVGYFGTNVMYYKLEMKLFHQSAHVIISSIRILTLTL
jgi:hypothetical protein